jgi:rifampin ADP-ribosylating transferase
MIFDPGNEVFKLCAAGMQLEGEGKPEEAGRRFAQAWETAVTGHERFTAAHYVARHQPTVASKLNWDEKALQLALEIEGEEIKGVYPSLYLNIGKCHEEMGNYSEAKRHYALAWSYCVYLAGDGYSRMIQSGIANALERIAKFV